MFFQYKPQVFSSLTVLKTEIVQPEKIIYNLSTVIYQPGFIMGNMQKD